jgi:hypothetical protein
VGDVRHRKSNGQVWWIAAVVGCGLILIAIAVTTRGFGLVKPKLNSSQDNAAQERCESEVLTRLVSPSTAKLSDIETTKDVMDPDSKDLFSLQLSDPLKGVDRARITVWNVTGYADSRNEFGDLMHERFSCRAYFVDGNLADTLVTFDHDH